MWSKEIVVLLVGLPLACLACGDGGYDDAFGGYGYGGEGAGSPSPSEAPSGQAECNERYFSKYSFECANIDCGEAMTCQSDLGEFTPDRCEPFKCNSDQDCEDDYRGLCSDVEWRCEPYIAADNLLCAVYDKGASRCGDGVCSDDESCSGCFEDCGYCAGKAPTMAPCSSHAECESGVCDDWCTGSCNSGYDCIDHENGLYGGCIQFPNGTGYCFPFCSPTDGCAEYPATQCRSLESVEGWDENVCVRPG